MSYGYDESNRLAREEKAAKKKKEEDTNMFTGGNEEDEFRRLRAEAVLRGSKHVDHFAQDMNDTQPVKAVRKPINYSELEDTKPRQAFTPTELAPKPKFNWVAFFVMVLSIGGALIVGYFIPGPFDEFLATVVISSVYGFLNAHDFKLKNIFKK